MKGNRPQGLVHRPWGVMAFPLSETELALTLQAAAGSVERVQVHWDDRYIDPKIPLSQSATMEWAACDGDFDYFRAVIALPTRRFQYLFEVGGGWWFGEGGVARGPEAAVPFQVPYLADADIPRFPAWAQDAVFYQIFPDRFANGDPGNDPPDAAAWGAPPEPRTRYGGDLKGIADRMEYLTQLGVNALYTTPVFRSPSPHRYDTADYYQVDPHLGDTESLRHLTATCHRHGVRLVLDAVFNHSGNRFRAFQDVLEKGAASPFADWFRIADFPVQQGGRINYETFANGIDTMPKLMTDRPDVREYLLGVARYWIEAAGIDGWRLDVANEVDHRFWKAFREAVKSARSDAFILGEVWHPAAPWLMGDEWDSGTNYPVRGCCLSFIGRGEWSPAEFDRGLARIRMAYPGPVNHLLINLLGSHDTPRIRTLCGGDVRRAALAATFLFTYVGIPLVYYGDELALEGEGDPHCRQAMPWELVESGEEPADWMHEHYRRLIVLRHERVSLRRGRFRTLVAPELGSLYAFVREVDDDWAVVVLNNGGEPVEIEVGELEPRLGAELPDVEASGAGTRQGAAWREVLGQAAIDGGRLHLPPYAAAILVPA